MAADDDLVPVGNSVHIGAGQRALCFQIAHDLVVVDQRSQGSDLVSLLQKVVGKCNGAVHAEAEPCGFG